jgi:UbiD family decarboxylase
VALTDLRDFVAGVEQRGRLRRVTADVSRDVDTTEIVDRVSKTRGSSPSSIKWTPFRGLYGCRTFWRRLRLLRRPLPHISRHSS